MVILLAVVIPRGSANNCRAIGSLAPASSPFGFPADIARRNLTQFGPRDRRATISLGRFRAANPAWRKLHLRRSGCRMPAFGEFLDHLPFDAAVNEDSLDGSAAGSNLLLWLSNQFVN